MSNTDLACYPVLPETPTGELCDRLARVRYLFTDLDATMLAPGSCALKGNDGTPSLTLVQAIVDLARAGIEIIPCSGRNRTMLQERRPHSRFQRLHRRDRAACSCSI